MKKTAISPNLKLQEVLQELTGELLELVEEDLVEPGAGSAPVDAGLLGVAVQGHAAHGVHVAAHQAPPLDHAHAHLWAGEACASWL